MKLSRIVILFFFIFANTIMSTNNESAYEEIPVVRSIRILLLGITGGGKTTFVNYIANFVNGTKAEDFPKLFPACTDFQRCNVEEYQNRNVEDHTDGQFSSVTQEPSTYVFRGRDYEVEIIDTPGFAHTAGQAQDDINATKILEFIAQAGDFNAICIVLNGATNRATALERYVVEHLKGIIPAKAYANIFIVLTYASYKSRNVTNFLNHVDLPANNIFNFENFALTIDGHKDIKLLDLADEPRCEEEDREELELFGEIVPEINENRQKISTIKNSWRSGERQALRMFKRILSLESIPANEIVRMVGLRNQITKKLLKIYGPIECLDSKYLTSEQSKDKLQNEIIQLYCELSRACLGSVSHLVNQSYCLLKKNEEDREKIANLNKDILLYIHEVTLLKERNSMLPTKKPSSDI